MFSSFRGLWRRSVPPPPLIFITHAKAGSTWMDNILRSLYRKRVAPRAFSVPEHFSFAQHRIYSAIFMSRAEFLQHPELFGAHRFVLIRDLRDTIISQYFSLRDTHGEDPAGIVAARRKVLLDLSEEDGLLYLIDNQAQKHATIQDSWVGTGTLVFRYEELLQRDAEVLKELLIGTFGHDISPERVEEVVAANRFESVFGRKLGEQDMKSHGRSGLPGQWKTHFTPRIAARFLERFGDILIKTGYEADHRWVDNLSAPAVPKAV